MSKKKIQEVKPDIVVEVKGGVVVGARANAEQVRYQVFDHDEGGRGPVLVAGFMGTKVSRSRLIELLGETIPNMICDSLQEEIREVLRKEGI